MMLAPTLAGNGPRTRTAARAPTHRVALDVAILLIALAIAGAFFFEGGLEAFIGAAVGAFLGLRNAHWRNLRITGAVSGAHAGLFAGALFAGFFHNALAAVFSAL